jgi:hypothetical protein
MAYYIFLKSLTSLEEFRKNHHVKIPPKSPCANFQNLGIFKNPIFNSEILFLDFGLASSLILFPAQPWPTSSLPVGLVGQNLSIFHRYRTCPFSLLVRFRYLSIFSTSKLVRFGLKTCPIWLLRPQTTARALGPLGPLGPCPVVSDPPPPPPAPVRLTSVPFPFFLNRGEVPCLGTPFRPFSSEPFLGR